MATWYDAKTFKYVIFLFSPCAVFFFYLIKNNFAHRDVVGLKTFTQLYLALGTFGLMGVDRLYSFMIVRILQKFSDNYRKAMKGDKVLKTAVTLLSNELEPLTCLPNNSKAIYSAALNKSSKFLGTFAAFIVRVGQLQLLRRLIGNELNFRCKLDSYNLTNTLKNINKALLYDVENHYHDKDRFPYPRDDSPLMSEIATYLDLSGVNDPFQKIYIATKPLDDFPLVVFLYVIGELPKLSYDQKSGAFLCKSNTEQLDGTPFVIGIITLVCHV